MENKTDSIEKSLQRIADSLERLELIMIRRSGARVLSSFWDALRAFQQKETGEEHEKKK